MLRRAAKLALGAATALTLMACYGGGPDDYNPSNYESCNDGYSGIDYDGDGYCSDVDCDDTDSYRYDNCGDPGCIDNDGDGYCSYDDCNDNNASIGPDCDCVDIDADGFCSDQDCDDQDPTLWDVCEDVCEVSIPITDLGEPVLGSTLEGNDNTQTCGAGANEVVYAFTVPGDPGVLQYVTADVTAETQHYLAARDSCFNASDIACGFETPHVELLAAPGDIYWLIVESATLLDAADFSLAIDVQPIVCGDGNQVGPEECDDGNLDDDDGCDMNCQIEGANP